MHKDFFLANRTSTFFVASALVSCLLIDSIAFGYMGWYMIQTILALYIVYTLSAFNEVHLLFLCAALVIESYGIYDSCSIALISIVVSLICGTYIRYLLNPGLIQRFFLLYIILFGQFCAEYFVMGLTLPFTYLLCRLFINSCFVAVL